MKKCTQSTRDCNKAMIILSSVVYDILMRKVHEWSLGDKSKEITNTADPEAIVYENLAEADSVMSTTDLGVRRYQICFIWDIKD